MAHRIIEDGGRVGLRGSEKMTVHNEEWGIRNNKEQVHLFIYYKGVANYKGCQCKKDKVAKETRG